MGLPEIPNAPADITPEAFFGSWLPEQAENFKDMAAQFAGDIVAGMSIRVTGDGGGEWTCSISKDGLKIDSGLNDDSPVTVIIDGASFKKAVTGEIKMSPPADAAVPSPEEAQAKIKDSIAAVKEIQGMMKYTIKYPEGDDFVSCIKFAGPLKDEPDVGITMDKEDADALAAGELNPQAAFMAGKLQIEGDMTLLMQLAPLMS
jgi:SCP-2 sterol transfer family